MPDLPEQPWELLKQPDQRSCGATVLVVARMLADPAYAASLDGSQCPVGLAFPRTVAGDKALQARFRTETLAMHQRVTGSSSQPNHADSRKASRLTPAKIAMNG